MTNHPEVDQTLERLVDQLRAAAGENLLGSALYGGLAKGRYTPGTSDVNVLAVVADATLPALLQLAPVLTAALRDSQVVSFVATPADLREAAVLFPVKVLDIQLWHRVLWGDVHLADVEVQPEALRLRSLQELKNMELRLRLRVVERDGESDALWRGLLRSLPKLAVTLEVLVRSRGLEVPADRPGLLRQAARKLGVAAGFVEPVADLRRRDPRPADEEVRRLLSAYLDLLAELCRTLGGVGG
ncbi:MAG TPA: hypothetical protein DD490_11720 [Acidobacteria bacterium]|nr:hypothetical protein [Acidobacteriota bacterium]